eukprot:7209629-Pyramimonas_sp.AAC.1
MTMMMLMRNWRNWQRHQSLHHLTSSSSPLSHCLPAYIAEPPAPPPAGAADEAEASHKCDPFYFCHRPGTSPLVELSCRVYAATPPEPQE